ncbi:MAG TPA: glycosyltransferase family 87 protein [Anaerolineae bacterium]|nr:glycosyltransferase family 87 protein [Anaerolineae bacterium]
MRSRLNLVLLLIGAACLAALALVIAQEQEWMVNRDWFTYWAGGRGVLEGLNVYASPVWRSLHERYGSTWFPNPIFIYAPPTALWVAPLAALPLTVASSLWVWFSALGVAISVVFVSLALHWKSWRRYIVWWGLAILFFLPVILTLLMGQVSALILLLIVLTGVLWQRQHWFMGGMLLSLVLIKPQPALLLVAMACVWLALNRQWRGIAGLGAGIACLFGASLLLFPNFFIDWQTVALNKVGGVSGRMPTIWGVAYDIGNPFGLEFVIAGALLLVLVGLNLWIVWRMSKRDALEILAVCAVFSVSLAPYLWTYDLILLILPLTVAAIRLDQRGAPFFLVALAPLAITILCYASFAISAARLSDTQTLSVTIAVGFVLWLALFNVRSLASQTSTRV